MLRAIIFDLDGVLVDSEPLMRFAFETAYRRVMGCGAPPTEAYLEHMGESFPRIMDHLGLPHTLWQPYRELCQEHLDRVAIFDESRDLLAWARSLGLKLAILTGKDRARTLQLLEHLNLRCFFDIVVASDQLCHPKPHPEGALLALQRLGCTAQEAVLVGDSVSDVNCARQAGIAVVAVTWGIKPERVQTLCQPDYIVHTWPDLCGVLRALYDGQRR